MPSVSLKPLPVPNASMIQPVEVSDNKKNKINVEQIWEKIKHLTQEGKKQAIMKVYNSYEDRAEKIKEFKNYKTAKNNIIIDPANIERLKDLEHFHRFHPEDIVLLGALKIPLSGVVEIIESESQNIRRLMAKIPKLYQPKKQVRKVTKTVIKKQASKAVTKKQASKKQASKAVKPVTKKQASKLAKAVTKKPTRKPATRPSKVAKAATQKPIRNSVFMI